MIYCHVTNGLVDHRSVFAAAIPADWPDRANWVASEDAQIGWSYDGSTFTAPVAPPPTSDELWVTLRTQRDGLLAACDYTQLPDAPDTDKAAWATYRQALRDLPTNTTNPANPAWPTTPGL